MRASDAAADLDCSEPRIIAAKAIRAVLAAQIKPADLVFEPCAGTGLLAAFARRAGARLALNEIDTDRADMLEAAFRAPRSTGHLPR